MAALGTIFVEMDIDRDRWSGAQRRLLKDATSTSLRIEDNFRKLGIKSSAEMDLMRAKITNSFNMIKNSSQATANDIVRAEQAKNNQLKALNEQQFGHQKSMLTQLKDNWVAAAAAVVAAWYAVSRALKVVGGIIMDSARYETLGIVMETIGHNAGYTSAQMYAFAEGLESTGISMTEARQSLSRMNQAQLDLSKSTQLARVAQDAAVIGMMNSSDAFNQLVYGIQSANVRVLRTIGINVSFEESYKKVAKQLGVTTTSFTELEKANIRMNAALEAGEVISGTYTAAMETAGKQVLSLRRYFDNLKVMLGTAFLPAFAEVVMAITGGMKDINKDLLGNLEKAKDWGVGLRLILIDIQAEFMRFAMFIDKIGGTLTSAQMLLYGPGRLLGIESSTKRFEAAADANMAFENRYLETEKKLQEIANRYVALEQSITPGGKAKAAAIKAAEEKAALANRLGPGEALPPDIDTKMLRYEEQAALMMAKSEETLTKQSDMEKFMEQDLTDALYEMRQKRLEDETGFAQKSLALRQWQHDAALQIMQIEQEQELRLTEQLAKQKYQTQLAYLNLGDALGNAAIAMTTKQGKAQFAIQKAFQVGMAIMDAWLAHNNALATIPYPFNIAAAAHALKIGLIGAAAIAAASIGQMASAGGGGGGGGTIATPTYPAYKPEYYEDQKKGSLTINIQGDVIGDEAYIEMLAEKISEAVENRDVIFVASNAKYAENLN